MRETSESGYTETDDYDTSLINKHSPEKRLKIKGDCDPMEGAFLKDWYEKHPVRHKQPEPLINSYCKQLYCLPHML